jgi:hypothetical protein
MLIFSLPKERAPGFLRGEPAIVKINGALREITFDAAAQVVRFVNDEGPQARKLIATTEEGDLVRFACTAADGSGIVIAPDGGFVAPAK